MCLGDTDFFGLEELLDFGGRNVLPQVGWYVCPLVADVITGNDIRKDRQKPFLERSHFRSLSSKGYEIS